MFHLIFLGPYHTFKAMILQNEPTFCTNSDHFTPKRPGLTCVNTGTVLSKEMKVLFLNYGAYHISQKKKKKCNRK